MYCSTMHRSLSTMQLVCADWYDDVKIIATDLLRPKSGKYSSTKRSDIHELKREFKRPKFELSYLNNS